MRTTITLEDDVAASLKRLGKGRGLKFKDLVNLALREGLKHLAKPTKPRKHFHTRAVDLGSCRTANVDNIGEILAVAEGESFK
jgi:hypothetical protein